MQVHVDVPELGSKIKPYMYIYAYTCTLYMYIYILHVAMPCLFV